MKIKTFFKKFISIILKPFKLFGKGLFLVLKPILRPHKRQKVRLGVFFIFILFFLSIFLDYPVYYDNAANWLNNKFDQTKYLEKINIPEFYKLDFHLGLDLQGGTHLVYDADTSYIAEKEREAALDGVRDVIERRVNAFGVSEPIVQTNKSGENWRVIVELAGISDVNAAIKMIGETPLLQFKEENAEPARELTVAEKEQMEEFNNTALARANEALAKLEQGSDFSTLALEYSEDLNTNTNGGDLGFIKSGGYYSDLFIEAQKIGANKMSQKLYLNDEGYNILKVGEMKEEGKEVKASHILICFKGTELCEEDISQEEALTKIQKIKERSTPENFSELVAEFSTEPGAAEREGDLGWFSSGMMVQTFEEAVFNQEVDTISDVVETQFGYHLIYKTDERALQEYNVARILLKTKQESDFAPPPETWKNTGLSGKQLKKSQVQFDPNTNEPQVALEFNNEGKELFAQITERNNGKLVAIFLDEYPISIPRVNEPIRDGRAVITGSFDLAEAKLLSQRLNAGALPVPINLINQQTVGAILGHESVTKSLYAGLWGLLVVAIFMILYYRLPGFLAVIALGIYSSVVLAIFKLELNSSLAFLITLLVLIAVLWHLFKSKTSDSEKFVFFILTVLISVFFYLLLTNPVTLTLAGIAGFLLSIGMAVDANVLIFERFKEELRLGKPLNSAIDEGFLRAWSSIRDGNISTLITCFILSTFGTSMIKGFAVTLGIGIIISMFSAIVITKLFMRLVAQWTQKEFIYSGDTKRQD